VPALETLVAVIASKQAARIIAGIIVSGIGSSLRLASKAGLVPPARRRTSPAS